MYPMRPMVLRAVLDPILLQSLRRDAEAVFAKGAPWAIEHGLSGPNLQESLPPLFNAFEASDAAALARGKLGGDLAVPLNHLLFRYRPANAAAGGNSFHQDHDLLPKQFPINVWIPLSRIDPECLGLSFVFPPSPVALSLPIDIEGYLEKTGGWVYTPDLEVGDAIVFNHLTIHGSYMTPKPAARYSVEFRVGRSDNLGDYAGEPMWRAGVTQ